MTVQIPTITVSLDPNSKDTLERLIVSLSDLVTLSCRATDCKHNRDERCNLKQIWMTEFALCGEYKYERKVVVE